MKRIIVPAVLVAALLAGCGQSTSSHHHIRHGGPRPTTKTPATTPKVSLRTWHIAGFTVKEIPLPSDYKPNENREFVVGTTLLKMAAKPPYTVTWQSLTSKKNGIVIEDGCPTDTLSAYADLNDGYNLNGVYAPGYAGFVCTGRQKSQLVLVHVPDMKVLIMPLPGYSKQVQDDYGLYLVGAGIWGTADHPYLTWKIWISFSSNANLGSGTVDLTTGKPVAIAPPPPPATLELQGAFVLKSPNGTRYRITKGSSGYMVSKWNGNQFQALGTVPFAPSWISNDNTCWAERLPTMKNPAAAPFGYIFTRETPGSVKIKSWRLVGTSFMFRTGFVAYTPGYNLDGPVRILFPEVDRTLTINNVYGQPMLAGFQRANNQIMITTSTPPVVIEVIPPS